MAKTTKKTTAKKTTRKSTGKTIEAKATARPREAGSSESTKASVSYHFSCSICGREFVAATGSAVCDGTLVSTTSEGQVVVMDVNRHSPRSMDRRQ